jgi:hypothetical protein
MDRIKTLAAQTWGAVKATPGWLWGAAHTLMGSRFFVAVSALSFTAFFAHVTNAPTRFPPITVASVPAMLGFAPPVEARPLAPDEVREQAGRAAEAGIPYVQPYIDSAREAIAGYFGANTEAVVAGNYLGLALSGFALVLGLYLLARQELRRA